ncbi:MAG: alkaline phosphatase family protein [Actinomycetota bacterium]|nr:alkaline phosphatase family protein [Actinomycetota bacterium]
MPTGSPGAAPSPSAADADASSDVPVLADYGGSSLIGVVPGLLAAPGQRPAWFPEPAASAAQAVLLVVDGLGWRQLATRRHLAPTLAAMAGGAITSVVPTTTATALTSIAVGAAPADHGMVGFRLRVTHPTAGPEVLNVLRWRTPSGDARKSIQPHAFQPRPAFGGRPVPVISRMEFAGTGFSQAHLGGGRMVGWATASGIGVEIGRALAAGEPLVYAYYDGLDKTAHVTGLGEHYDAELVAIDGLVAAIIDRLPPGAALVVTADHGQVDVGARARSLPPEILALTAMVSGEARFRWLHAADGRVAELLEACREWCGADAWVRTIDDLDAEGWYGGPLDERIRSRLGDVAVVARGQVAYLEGADPGESRLVSMHGSLTADEMWVPLVAAGT